MVLCLAIMVNTKRLSQNDGHSADRIENDRMTSRYIAKHMVRHPYVLLSPPEHVSDFGWHLTRIDVEPTIFFDKRTWADG